VLDAVLPFTFAGVIIELAILLFMMFRRARGSCLAQLVLAFFAFYTGLMALLAIAGMAEKPAAFTDQGRIAFPAAFVILAMLIVAVNRGVPQPLVVPRKRPVILDMLGCVGLGILGVVVLIAGIATLILLAR